MKTYNILLITTKMEVIENTELQPMFDKAYELAEQGKKVSVYDYDDDDAAALIECYKTSNGKVITHYSKEIAELINA